MDLRDQPTELTPGTILHDNYEILETLKAGGMGRIYRARHVHFGKVYAIKQTFFADQDQRHWFLNEATTLHNLTHQGLPRVTDYFCISNNCYLVMELIEGRDLKEILDEEGALRPGLLIPWVIQVLKVLCYLHSEEPAREAVIHRDIKPQNIKVDRQGNIFLLDFGLAKMGTKTIIPGAFTPEYSPPEQVRGLGTDERSDLFALGAAVYHLLTGVLPENVFKRQSAIQQNQADPLQRADILRPEITEGLATIVETAMALEPEKRFGSAQALLNSIEEETADSYVRRGALHVEEQEYDRAIAALNQAILLDDKIADAHFWRAKAFAAKGDSQLAIADCMRELFINPANAAAYKLRGNQHFDQGNFGLAIADYTAGVEHDQENSDFYFNRGLAYSKIGDNARAVSEFQRAIEFSPKGSEIELKSTQEIQKIAAAHPTEVPIENSQSDPSMGAYGLLISSVLVTGIYSLLYGLFTSTPTLQSIYLGAAFGSLLILILSGIVLRFSKYASPVPVIVAFLILTSVFVLLLERWSSASHRVQEAEQKAEEAKRATEAAEQMAGRASDDLAIEQARRAGKEVWQVAILENRTREAVDYSIFNEDRSWQQKTLEPTESITHWRKGVDILVKFNRGGEIKQYRIDAKPVIGREPDEQEKLQGAVNFFVKTENSPLDLYSARPLKRN